MMKKTILLSVLFALTLVFCARNAYADYLEELINYNELILVCNIEPQEGSPNSYYNLRKYNCGLVSVLKNDFSKEIKVKKNFKISGKIMQGDFVPVLYKDGDSYKEVGLAIPKVDEDLKPGKYIVFLNIRNYYIGAKKKTQVDADLYDLNEKILPYSESLEKKAAQIIGDLKYGKSVEKAERVSLPKKLDLSISISKVNPEGEYPEYLLSAKIKNISSEDAYFYLENCEIDFWSISVNEGRYFPMSVGVHAASCLYKNLVKLSPNQSIDHNLTWTAFPSQHKNIVYTGEVKTIKVRYDLGLVGNNFVSLESNLLNIQ